MKAHQQKNLYLPLQVLVFGVRKQALLWRRNFTQTFSSKFYYEAHYARSGFIIPPSGMSVSSSEFVESGAGQYTATHGLEPGKEKYIEVRIAANQVGNFNVNGRVVYHFGNNTTDAENISLDLPIQVKEVPDTPDTQPTPALTSTATHTFNNS